MLSACSSSAAPVATPAPTGTTHTIHVTFTLNASDVESVGDFGSTTCRGLRAYDDIRDGAPVIVKNEASVIIASSVLANSQRHGACVFRFDIPDVPDATFYSIEVTKRGAVTHSKADMEASGWAVSLTLGE